MPVEVNPSFKHALALAFALFLTALCPRAGAAAGLDVAHFTLGNGLEVVVIPDHRTPVVTHMVRYKFGSADDTAGKSGLAHFPEHLSFKGTMKNPPGRYSQTVRPLVRPGERIHHSTTTRPTTKGPARAPQDPDGVRV